MHRIDTTDAVGNLFVDGDPQMGVIATQVDAAWFNSVQEEIVNVVLGAGIALNKSDQTQLLQAIQTLAGDAGGNVLLNGDFQVWQRTGPTGGTVTSNPTYAGPDRWRLDRGDASSGASCSRVAFAATQTDVQIGTPFMLRFQRSPTVGSANDATIDQCVEGVDTLAGQAIVAAFEVSDQTNPANLPLIVECIQHFGTGGSPSADVTTQLGVLTLTNDNWQRSQFTATLPSISGKTIGTNADDCLVFRIRIQQDIDLDLRLTNVLLTSGSTAPLYTRRDIYEELRLCRRYYESSYDLDVAVGATNQLGSAYNMQHVVGNPAETEVWNSGLIRYQTPKRANPTINWYDPSGGGVDEIFMSTNTDQSPTVSGGAGFAAAPGTINILGTVDTDERHKIEAHFAADAELDPSL